MSGQVSPQEFTLKAIEVLKERKSQSGRINPNTGKPYVGIHTVYDGFNAAFKDYFGTDPVEAVNAMVKAGIIAGHPTRGGYMIYAIEDAPKPKAASVLLDAMGLGDNVDAAAAKAARNARATRNGPVTTRKA